MKPRYDKRQIRDYSEGSVLYGPRKFGGELVYGQVVIVNGRKELHALVTKVIDGQFFVKRGDPIPLTESASSFHRVGGICWADKQFKVEGGSLVRQNTSDT